jgi:hypothetical protein
MDFALQYKSIVCLMSSQEIVHFRAVANMGVLFILNLSSLELITIDDTCSSDL